MASGHLAHQGDAEGVTQPGGTPGSTTGEIPVATEEERDVIGVAGEPGRRAAPEAPQAGEPVDAAAREAAAQAPGQQLAAGEG